MFEIEKPLKKSVHLPEVKLGWQRYLRMRLFREPHREGAPNGIQFIVKIIEETPFFAGYVIF